MAGSDAADGDLTTLIVPATPTLIESVAPTIGPDAPLTPPEQMPPSPLYRVHFYAAECFRAWVHYCGAVVRRNVRPVISDTLFYGVTAHGFEEKLYMVCARDCGFFEMCKYEGCQYTFEFPWCCDCNAPMQTEMLDGNATRPLFIPVLVEYGTPATTEEQNGSSPMTLTDSDSYSLSWMMSKKRRQRSPVAK